MHNAAPAPDDQCADGARCRTCNTFRRAADGGHGAMTAAPTLAYWIGTPDCGTSLDEAALAPDARGALEGLGSDSRRQDWRASRALLQKAGVEATTIGALGAGPQPHVSLSHSRGYAAVLTGRPGLRVGVDLETAARRRWGALATFAFAPEEARALTGLDTDTCRRDFLIRWTLKEAFTKALGLPLTAALRECVFLRTVGGEWRGTVPVATPWRASVHEAFDACVVAAVVIGEAELPAPACWPDGTVTALATLRGG